MSARVRTAVIAAVLALGLSAPLASAGAAQTDTQAKASYIQVVDDVMCVVCHEPLAVAQSPEAFQERQYIRTLIAQGQTRRQIEHNLVEQYGPAVLARPPAHGVNLLVYIVPPLVLILGLVTLAVFLPRWRRRARQSDAEQPPRPATALDPADAQRLNDDLGRFA
ncbi:MAG: cytochrome c-type biogenesis protein [Solirubrobacteraceae bacterium]